MTMSGWKTHHEGIHAMSSPATESETHPLPSIFNSEGVDFVVERPVRLARVLGFGSAIALVVGGVIGSGIFVKPGNIAAQLGSFPAIVSVWVLGAILCALGGLCFSELAAMMPGAGGPYLYIRRAYGPLGGFLFGWTEVLFNRPATTGALAVIFSQALSSLVGLELDLWGKGICSVVVICFIAAVNIRGVIWGGFLQNATTWIKVGFLAFVGFVPILISVIGFNAIRLENYATTIPISTDASFTSRFSVALLAVMWAYNGWHGVTPVAEEIKRPRRNVVRAILLGILIIFGLYITANITYHGVLSMEQVAASGEHTAEVVLASVFGPIGASAMAVVLMCSTFGAINSDLLITPRVTYAMGRDGHISSRFGDVHKTYRTPVQAIITHALLASALVIATTVVVAIAPQMKQESIFDLLTNFAIFASSIFYLLTVLAVPILRWREPKARRPFRVWGYPVVPFLFVGTYIWFLVQVYLARPFESRMGLLFIVLGLPVYWWLQNRRISRSSVSNQ